MNSLHIFVRYSIRNIITMKTSIWFTALIMTLAISMEAQELNKKVYDETRSQDILLGYCDCEGLKTGEFGESFGIEYCNYETDKEIVKQLKEHDLDYNIILVMATWCHDSQEQVPRFYKILDEAFIPSDIMMVACVDGEKRSHVFPVSEYNIERVPTFIFRHNGKEIGRITETPQTTLEEDMLKIIN